MRMDKLTVKAQEAIQAAQSLADQGNHQAIEPEHLLLALLQQQEGVVGPLLGKLGARPEALARQIQAEVDKLPAVRGGSGRQYASSRVACCCCAKASARSYRRSDSSKRPSA